MWVLSMLQRRGLGLTALKFSHTELSLYKSESKRCPHSVMLGCLIAASEWAGERVQLIQEKKNVNSCSHAIQLIFCSHMCKKIDQVLPIRSHPYLSYHLAYCRYLGVGREGRRSCVYKDTPFSIQPLVSCTLHSQGGKEQPGIAGWGWAQTAHCQPLNLAQSAPLPWNSERKAWILQELTSEVFALCKVHLTSLSSAVSGGDILNSVRFR